MFSISTSTTTGAFLEKASLIASPIPSGLVLIPTAPNDSASATKSGLTRFVPMGVNR